MTPEEKKQATKRIDMEAAAAEKKWAEAAKKGDWTLPRTPLSCYRFGPKVEKDPRLEPEYVSGVLEDLGIVGKDALPHLSPADRKAVVDQLTRKAAAFWRVGSPRTCIRAFAHDVVTTGPPLRSHPTKLRGDTAAFVEASLEEDTRLGLYSRGMSP